MKLKIVHKDKDYIVIHKPSGLVVYPDSKEMVGKSALEPLEKQLHRKVYPVHRLDRQTCGLLAYALTPAMAAKLTELFRSRVVRKQYLAIVHGKVPAKGTIDKPLQKHKEKIEQEARTDFVCVASIELDTGEEKRWYSLVKLDPRTGRYHQIRRHLRAIEHPIVGDPEYGNKWDNRYFAEHYKIQRTLLSATDLIFPNPYSGLPIKLHTLPDTDFLGLCKKFQWQIR